MTRRAYSRAEVAEMVGVSASTVKRAIKDGELHAKYVRRQVRISAEEVERWWAGLTDSPNSAQAATTTTPIRLVTAPKPTPRRRVQRCVDIVALFRERGNFG